jgi:hypothetical protein
MSGLREKIKGEIQKVPGASAYEGLSADQIFKRMALGGEEDPEFLTPLEGWMKRYGMTREEVMATGRFNLDGSFKGGEHE